MRMNKELAVTHKYSGIKLAEEASKIPSVSKIISVFASFKKQGFGDIKTNSDLESWASGKHCRNKLELSRKRNENPHQLVVISEPLMREIEVEVTDEKGKPVNDAKGKTKKRKKTACAFV